MNVIMCPDCGKLVSTRFPMHDCTVKQQVFDFCPFCGSTDINHESARGVRYARCQKCSAAGGHVFDFENDRGVPFVKETVVKRWNKRVSERKP